MSRAMFKAQTRTAKHGAAMALAAALITALVAAAGWLIAGDMRQAYRIESLSLQKLEASHLVETLTDKLTGLTAQSFAASTPKPMLAWLEQQVASDPRIRYLLLVDQVGAVRWSTGPDAAQGRLSIAAGTLAPSSTLAATVRSVAGQLQASIALPPQAQTWLLLGLAQDDPSADDAQGLRNIALVALACGLLAWECLRLARWRAHDNPQRHLDRLVQRAAALDWTRTLALPGSLRGPDLPAQVLRLANACVDRCNATWQQLAWQVRRAAQALPEQAEVVQALLVNAQAGRQFSEATPRPETLGAGTGDWRWPLLTLAMADSLLLASHWTQAGPAAAAASPNWAVLAGLGFLLCGVFGAAATRRLQQRWPRRWAQRSWFTLGAALAGSAALACAFFGGSVGTLLAQGVAGAGLGVAVQAARASLNEGLDHDPVVDPVTDWRALLGPCGLGLTVGVALAPVLAGWVGAAATACVAVGLALAAALLCCEAVPTGADRRRAVGADPA